MQKVGDYIGFMVDSGAPAWRKWLTMIMVQDKSNGGGHSQLASQVSPNPLPRGKRVMQGGYKDKRNLFAGGQPQLGDLSGPVRITWVLTKYPKPSSRLCNHNSVNQQPQTLK